jgi:mannosyltransferase OCH1-like enzyme
MIRTPGSQHVLVRIELLTRRASTFEIVLDTVLDESLCTAHLVSADRNSRSLEIKLLEYQTLAAIGPHATSYRTHVPTLEHAFATSIPRRVWQFSQRPEAHSALDAAFIGTWSLQNPTWDHFVLTDTDVDNFVSVFYNKTIYKAFKKLPTSEMKIDIFRYGSAVWYICEGRINAASRWL